MYLYLYNLQLFDSDVHNNNLQLVHFFQLYIHLFLVLGIKHSYQIVFLQSLLCHLLFLSSLLFGHFCGYIHWRSIRFLSPNDRMFWSVDKGVRIDSFSDEFQNGIHDGLYVSVFKQRTGIDILPHNKYRRTDTEYSGFVRYFYAIFKGDRIVCRLRQVYPFIPVGPMEKVSAMISNPDNHLPPILRFKHSINITHSANVQHTLYYTQAASPSSQHHSLVQRVNNSSEPMH